MGGRDFIMILCVSRTSLLCTGSIPAGNHIVCMMYNSFNEKFANLVLDFTESGKEFTEVRTIGVWIKSLRNCFVEYIYFLTWNTL